jgi:TonB family protein
MRILKGFAASIMIHLFIFLSCYMALMWWKNSSFAAIDIDLSTSTLMLRPSQQANKPVQPAITVKDWYIGKVVNPPIAAKRVTATPETEEAAVSTCPPPCPDNPNDWVAAGSASRRPVWAQGFITEDDYPKEARAQGVEGVVKVDVFIDAQGKVRDVRVIQSANPRFTDVVVEKLKKARFEPALDSAGRPIAVHMAVPIVFELR